jgi:hypothetical protein
MIIFLDEQIINVYHFDYNDMPFANFTLNYALSLSNNQVDLILLCLHLHSLDLSFADYHFNFI